MGENIKKGMGFLYMEGSFKRRVLSYGSTISLGHSLLIDLPQCHGNGGCGISEDSDSAFHHIASGYKWSHFSTPVASVQASHVAQDGSIAANSTNLLDFFQRPAL